MKNTSCRNIKIISWLLLRRVYINWMHYCKTNDLNYVSLLKLVKLIQTWIFSCHNHRNRKIVYHIGRVMCYIVRMQKTYKMWQKTYVHMLSTTHILNLSNKPLITQHIDRKMNTDVTDHTLKMGTLCQYFSIITILLKTFSSCEIFR